MIRTELYKEKDSNKHDNITKFIRDCKLPDQLLKDYSLAVYHHQKYVSTLLTDKSLPDVSKPYFLYIWFCSRNIKVMTPNMKHYAYFKSELFGNIVNMSYRDFTQMYTDPIIDDRELNIHYDCYFNSDIYHTHPISLKSVLDRMKLQDESSYYILVERNLAIVKAMPKPMEKLTNNITNTRSYEKDHLIMYLLDVTIKCDVRLSNIISKNVSAFRDAISSVCKLVGSSNVSHNSKKQTFYFPSAEIKYNQMLEWLPRSGLKYNTIENLQHIIVENMFGGYGCEIVNRVLESNRCYDNGVYEIYRLAGERVLEITVYTDIDRQEIEKEIRRIRFELDQNIVDEIVDPMDLEVSEIAKLRATNSKVFDSAYCRKAPPNVQPIIIRSSEVQEHLDRGKMILIYDGKYYTTKDRDISEGQDYIGMINKFGDYDPSREYIPIIRTYKKNHLLSLNFKEMKAYLLRHSSDPNTGRVSREDMLLPRNMEYLYNINIDNPNPIISSIHTKKTSVSKSNKVFTAEVPDYIKSLLGTSSVKRLTIQGSGSRLLDCCGIDKQIFKQLCLQNSIKHLDLLGIDSDITSSHIDSGWVDHRLYGKIIEEHTKMSLIVFDMEHIIPYRYSKPSKDNYILLFKSNDGTYDRIVTDNSHIEYVKRLIYENPVPDLRRAESTPKRCIDYTKKMLGVVSHLATFFEMSEYEVKYHLIEECECIKLLEQLYSRPIYYEGYVKSINSKYHSEIISMRKQYSTLKPNTDFILNLFGMMIHSMVDKTVCILSPVDMSKYNKWKFTLEACLYDSPKCYLLEDNEEVQYIQVV